MIHPIILRALYFELRYQHRTVRARRGWLVAAWILAVLNVALVCAIRHFLLGTL